MFLVLCTTRNDAHERGRRTLGPDSHERQALAWLVEEAVRASHLLILPHPRLALPFLTADIMTVNSSKSMQSLPSWSTYRGQKTSFPA